MTLRARGPDILHGALVSVDPQSPSPSVIAFQYNPATLKRSLQPRLVGGEEQDRSQAVRFIGAPVEQISADVEIDATDQLEKSASPAIKMGIRPQLAALELLAYPSIAQVQQMDSQAAQGTLEVAPLTAPRTLFVWGPKRVLPVRLLSYQISEEAFDAMLNPIRATVSLSMRVLNYSDLNSSNKEYHQFMAYQQGLESIARSARASDPKKIVGVDPGQF